MPTGYSRSPKLLKGALVELAQPFLGPVPNVIDFQYNPDTLTRELNSNTPSAPGGEKSVLEKGTAAAHDPREALTLTLILDAADDLEENRSVAVVSGVANRIAALEQLLYPFDQTVIGKELALLGKLLDDDYVPRNEVPIVLFAWGPGLVLPVRLTELSVEEQAFLPTLYPIRAKVNVRLTVLEPDAILPPGTKRTPAREIAIAAYTFTRAQREVLAHTGVGEQVRSVLERIPFL